MRFLNAVNNIKEWHMDTRMETIAKLVGIEDVVVVPYLVDALRDDGCEKFADGFVEADRPHIGEVSIAWDLRNQTDEFVFHPDRDGSVHPDEFELPEH